MLPKWGVPIEVRVGFLLMLIGDINVIVALLHWNLPTILLIMFLIELFGGLIVFSLSIFTSEDEYKKGKHKEDSIWPISYTIFFGFLGSLNTLFGRFDIGLPAVAGIILTLIGALLVYSK